MNIDFTDTDAMDEIHAILDGGMWSAATIEWVAEVVTKTGRVIHPPTIDTERHHG